MGRVEDNWAEEEEGDLCVARDGAGGLVEGRGDVLRMADDIPDVREAEREAARTASCLHCELS